MQMNAGLTWSRSGPWGLSASSDVLMNVTYLVLFQLELQQGYATLILKCPHQLEPGSCWRPGTPVIDLEVTASILPRVL